MIFLMQFGINKHLESALRARAILSVFEKFTPALIPNCTRKHEITYTNYTICNISLNYIICV